MSTGLRELVAIVESALISASAETHDQQSVGRLHASRSRAFVSHLADGLRVRYSAEPTTKVLSKYEANNRSEFGLNELLYDVLVCRTERVSSANGSRDLTAVTGAVLAVESELARDSREALKDFNKLVISAAETKLFVGPKVSKEEEFLQPLAAGAARTTGALFAILVPHPKDWTTEEIRRVSGYAWNQERWVRSAKDSR